MLRIVPHTVPRVGRSYEHFPDGFELHLLLLLKRFRMVPVCHKGAPLIRDSDLLFLWARYPCRGYVSYGRGTPVEGTFFYGRGTPVEGTFFYGRGTPTEGPSARRGEPPCDLLRDARYWMPAQALLANQDTHRP